MLVAGGLEPHHRSRERGTLRSSNRDRTATGSPPSPHTPWGHGDVAAQRQGARRGRRKRVLLSCERGTLRSSERDLDGDRQPHYRTRSSHGDVAAQWQGACRRRAFTRTRLYWLLYRGCGAVRSGEWDLDIDREPRSRTQWSHGDIAAQRRGARRRRKSGCLH